MNEYLTYLKKKSRLDFPVKSASDLRFVRNSNKIKLLFQEHLFQLFRVSNTYIWILVFEVTGN